MWLTYDQILKQAARVTLLVLQHALVLLLLAGDIHCSDGSTHHRGIICTR